MALEVTVEPPVSRLIMVTPSWSRSSTGPAGGRLEPLRRRPAALVACALFTLRRRSE
jgi:hypothetical protein